MCGCLSLRVRGFAFTTRVTDTSPSERLKRDEEGQWQEPANKHVKTYVVLSYRTSHVHYCASSAG